MIPETPEKQAEEVWETIDRHFNQQMIGRRRSIKEIICERIALEIRKAKQAAVEEYRKDLLKWLEEERVNRC